MGWSMLSAQAGWGGVVSELSLETRAHKRKIWGFFFAGEKLKLSVDTHPTPPQDVVP